MITIKYNLPTHSPYYGLMLNGDKTFDIRIRQTHTQLMVGDHVKFWEENPKKNEMTNEWFVAKVTYICNSRDIDFWPRLEADLERVDLVVFSFKIVETS